VLRGWGGDTKEGKYRVSSQVGTRDVQGSHSCDMGSEVLERLDALWVIPYSDIKRRRLGPFEARECTVDIMAELKSETGPERWNVCQGGAPISTDVRGDD
jgi:hypothetical protein